MVKGKESISYEHLEFIVKTTTPYERFKWLEDAWNFWHKLNYQKTAKVKERERT